MTPPAEPDSATRPIHVVKAELFRVLGHPTRVRILELLRDGEQSVGALQAALPMDSSGTSQHLAALRRQGLVEGRREGTSIFYRAKDPRVFHMLESARQILTSSLAETRALLDELERDAPDASSPAPRAPRRGRTAR
jgi:ArsR family transcriptional regulator